MVDVESRGFIVGALLALRLEKGFIPIRKVGKLPGPTHGIEFRVPESRESYVFSVLSHSCDLHQTVKMVLKGFSKF